MAADIANRPSSAVTAARPGASEGAERHAIRPGIAGWGAWAGGLLAAGLSAAALTQLSRVSSEALAILRNLSPLVWAVFAVLCLVQPVADMVIFRRLWRLPIRSFAVVLRKVVINEFLFGYSGELYFFLWAKRQPELSRTPFGDIKDVNILSALGGNVLTLIMLPISAVALQRVDLTRMLGPALWPGVALVALSFGALLFGRRVFSLPRRELAYVASVHLVRLLASSCLTLLLWRLALPDVALGVWVVLLTSRLLLARLPFVANKDLVFANLVLALFGAASPTAQLLATLSLLTLLTHLAATILFSAPELLRALGRGRFGAS